MSFSASGNFQQFSITYAYEDDENSNIQGVSFGAVGSGRNDQVLLKNSPIDSHGFQQQHPQHHSNFYHQPLPPPRFPSHQHPSSRSLDHPLSASSSASFFISDQENFPGHQHQQYNACPSGEMLWLDDENTVIHQQQRHLSGGGQIQYQQQHHYRESPSKFLAVGPSSSAGAAPGVPQYKPFGTFLGNSPTKPMVAHRQPPHPAPDGFALMMQRRREQAQFDLIDDVSPDSVVYAAPKQRQNQFPSYYAPDQDALLYDDPDTLENLCSPAIFNQGPSSSQRQNCKRQLIFDEGPASGLLLDANDFYTPQLDGFYLDPPITLDVVKGENGHRIFSGPDGDSFLLEPKTELLEYHQFEEQNFNPQQQQEEQDFQQQQKQKGQKLSGSSKAKKPKRRPSAASSRRESLNVCDDDDQLTLRQDEDDDEGEEGKAPEEPQIASNGWRRPPYSYSCMIGLALKNSETGELTVSEIYAFLCEHFPYFLAAPSGWKNSIRHNLSLNKCFQKIEVEIPGQVSRKSCLWRINPNRVVKMDKELAKWRIRAGPGILAAMAHPHAIDEIQSGRMGMPPEVRGRIITSSADRFEQFTIAPNGTGGGAVASSASTSRCAGGGAGGRRQGAGGQGDEPKVIVRRLVSGFNDRFKIYTNTTGSSNRSRSGSNNNGNKKGGAQRVAPPKPPEIHPMGSFSLPILQHHDQQELATTTLATHFQQQNPSTEMSQKRRQIKREVLESEDHGECLEELLMIPDGHQQNPDEDRQETETMVAQEGGPTMGTFRREIKREVMEDQFEDGYNENGGRGSTEFFREGADGSLRQRERQQRNQTKTMTPKSSSVGRGSVGAEKCPSRGRNRKTTKKPATEGSELDESGETVVDQNRNQPEAKFENATETTTDANITKIKNSVERRLSGAEAREIASRKLEFLLNKRVSDEYSPLLGDSPMASGGEGGTPSSSSKLDSSGQQRRIRGRRSRKSICEEGGGGSTPLRASTGVTRKQSSSTKVTTISSASPKKKKKTAPFEKNPGDNEKKPRRRSDTSVVLAGKAGLGEIGGGDSDDFTAMASGTLPFGNSFDQQQQRYSLPASILEPDPKSSPGGALTKTPLRHFPAHFLHRNQSQNQCQEPPNVAPSPYNLTVEREEIVGIGGSGELFPGGFGEENPNAEEDDDDIYTLLGLPKPSDEQRNRPQQLKRVQTREAPNFYPYPQHRHHQRVTVMSACETALSANTLLKNCLERRSQSP